MIIRFRTATSLLFAMCFAVPGALAGAADDLRREGVRFQSGADRAVIKATIKGRETVDYVFQAAQGQTLSVELKSSNRFNYFNVLPPEGDEALFVGSSAVDPTRFGTRLQEAGEYRIRVYLMRNAARRNESAAYTLSVRLVPAAANTGPDNLGYPTRLDQGGKALDETLSLMGIRFHVTCTGAGSINTLRIAPSGLEIDNTPISREVDGSCTGAEVNDLNADGSPEVYVYINSAGSGSYGSLAAYAANRRKSLSDIYLPPLEQHQDAARGYQGHDEFAVLEGTFVRRFPVYRDGDTNAKPTGGMRQLQYKLVPGEANWQLRLDRIVAY